MISHLQSMTNFNMSDSIEISGQLNVNDTTLSVSVSEGDDTINDSSSSIIGGVDPSNARVGKDIDALDFDSISSVGYNEEAETRRKNEVTSKTKIRGMSSSDSVSSRKSIQRNHGQLPPRAGNQTVNKLKAEIAMLHNELVKAEAADKTMLQDKIREYR